MILKIILAVVDEGAPAPAKISSAEDVSAAFSILRRAVPHVLLPGAQRASAEGRGRFGGCVPPDPEHGVEQFGNPGFPSTPCYPSTKVIWVWVATHVSFLAPLLFGSILYKASGLKKFIA